MIATVPVTTMKTKDEKTKKEQKQDRFEREWSRMVTDSPNAVSDKTMIAYAIEHEFVPDGSVLEDAIRFHRDELAEWCVMQGVPTLYDNSYRHSLSALLHEIPLIGLTNQYKLMPFPTSKAREAFGDSLVRMAPFLFSTYNVKLLTSSHFDQIRADLGFNVGASNSLALWNAYVEKGLCGTENDSSSVVEGAARYCSWRLLSVLDEEDVKAAKLTASRVFDYCRLQDDHDKSVQVIERRHLAIPLPTDSDDQIE
jgi:hypothetical protein